ncbi:MAG: hypothetical protein QOJ92_2826 [Frankiales bacterium]|jgi:hypothetical protein|nr:hypothetical protein [Frankiales bacterium]MDX6275616.1 hypothetical protein [Frankiales bacterium]
MRRRPILLAGLLLTATAAVAAPATAGASAPQRQLANCYGYDFPDEGLQYCVYPGAKSGECLITEKRTTFIGTETRCVQRRP